MIKIRDFFREREEQYDSYTTIILDEMSVAFEVIEDLLDEETAKFLEWKSTELVGDHIIVLGMITYPIGHKVELKSGEFVTVDEDSQEILQRIVRLGIPAELIDNGKKEDIKKFLLEHNAMFDGSEEEQPKKKKSKKKKATEQQTQQVLWFAENVSKGKIN